MTNKLDTGGPAFGEQYDIRHQPDFETVPGMTWLDYCAIDIMGELIHKQTTKELLDTKNALAVVAYALAKAMLAEKRRLEGGGE